MLFSPAIFNAPYVGAESKTMDPLLESTPGVPPAMADGLEAFLSGGDVGVLRHDDRQVFLDFSDFGDIDERTTGLMSSYPTVTYGVPDDYDAHFGDGSGSYTDAGAAAGGAGGFGFGFGDAAAAGVESEFDIPPFVGSGGGGGGGGGGGTGGDHVVDDNYGGGSGGAGGGGVVSSRAGGVGSGAAVVAAAPTGRRERVKHDHRLFWFDVGVYVQDLVTPTLPVTRVLRDLLILLSGSSLLALLRDNIPWAVIGDLWTPFVFVGDRAERVRELLSRHRTEPKLVLRFFAALLLPHHDKQRRRKELEALNARITSPQYTLPVENNRWNKSHAATLALVLCSNLTDADAWRVLAVRRP
jgi:hypothetical protein